MTRFYVTMGWEDFPEGGTYGDVIEAADQDAAIEQCKKDMAACRADGNAEDAEADAAEILEEYNNNWTNIDCWDVDEFIERHGPKPSRAELIAALADNQAKWEDEEDSVKEEHEELMEANEELLARCETSSAPPTLQLFSVESGTRAPGDSDDRDIYAVATDKADAITLWRQYYELEEDENPDRVWLIPVPVAGPARVFQWGSESPQHMKEV